MIEIITEKVTLPEDSDSWRYDRNSISTNVWNVYDKEKNKIVYKGGYDTATLAWYNLNKKHYKKSG